MTTVLYIHGTSERQASLGKSFATIRDRLSAIGVAAAPSDWGDYQGYRLRAGGISMPDVQPASPTLGGGLSFGVGAGDDEDDAWVELWGLLLDAPLLELRALAASAGPADGAGAQLLAALHTLAPEALSASESVALVAAGVSDALPAALAALRGDAELPALLAALPSDLLDSGRAALARAILATATIEAQAQGADPALLDEARLRERSIAALMAAISAAAGADGAQSFGPLSDFGSELLARTLTDPLKPLRAKITGFALGLAGDILVYQGQGARIREQIASDMAKISGPVVLLAHSLGGVACVDLLIERNLRDRVALLITVGSQAPIFYEMGALQQLSYGRPLPAHFPPWLNLFDKRDFLGFQGEPLFNSAGSLHVRDVVVNNRQPFPAAHTSYWANEAAWNRILAAVLDPQSIWG